MFGYVGKRVVVNGCFSGIGKSTAQLLGELGAEVHGLDVRAADLPLASFTQLDLRDPKSIEAAISAFGGGVDALFNCAGIPPGLPPLDVMKVNYLGTKYLTDQILARMVPGGAIVNVASTGGLAWRQHLPELLQLANAESFAEGLQWCDLHRTMIAEGYRLSKEAIIVWTMLGATQQIRRQIRMNCTIPGAVQTPMLDEIEKVTPTATIDAIAQPIGRRSNADEQAMALIFLNSPGASYINGTALPVDGGFMAAMAINAANQ